MGGCASDSLVFFTGKPSDREGASGGIIGGKAAGRKKLLIIPESLQKRLVISADEYYLINWNAE